MVMIPAFCPTHGPFPSGIAATNTTGLTMRGNRSSCPRCGQLSPVLDGTFDVVGDVVTVVSAPDWSLERLRELQDLLRWAQAELPDGDAEAVLQRIDERAPSVGQRLREHGTELTLLLTAVGILIAVLQTLIMLRAPSLGPDDMRRIVEDSVRQVTGEGAQQPQWRAPP